MVLRDVHLLLILEELTTFISILMKKIESFLHYGDVTDAISVSSLIKKLNRQKFII